RRTRQPNFANARSVRNALDRSRLRQVNRLFAAAMQGGAPIDAAALTLITTEDIRASRVFAEPLAQNAEPSGPFLPSGADEPGAAESGAAASRAVTAPPG
ncbi:CbbX protein, partial [Paraburkholderia sp. SIMBA_055]